jgi:hypothetical protein
MYCSVYSMMQHTNRRTTIRFNAIEIEEVATTRSEYRADLVSVVLAWQKARSGPEDPTMAKGEQRGNREAKKPKKEKPKVIAAAPSLKGLMPSADAKPRKK